MTSAAGALFASCGGEPGIEPAPTPEPSAAAIPIPATATPEPPVATPSPAPAPVRPSTTVPPTVAPSATPRPLQARSLEADVQAGRLPTLAARLPVDAMVPDIDFVSGVHGGSITIPLRSAVDTNSLESWFGHEPLIRWDSAWRTLRPNLAASWEFSPDSRRFTFHLRRGVRWSDGTPFTSGDLAFWYREIVLDDEVTPAKPDWLTVGGRLGAVETPDDATVVFVFDTPNGLFPRRLAGLGAGQFWPQAEFARQYHIRYNRAYVERLTKEQAQPSWANVFNSIVNVAPELGPARWYRAGTPTLAPWVVTSSLSEGPRLAAKRNPYYWKVDRAGAQLPYLDEVNAVVADTPEAVAVLMARAHLDVYLGQSGVLPASSLAPYRNVAISPDSPNTCLLVPNLNHPDRELRALFRNREFRIGLSLAINRADVIARSPELVGRHWQVAPRPESPYFDEQWATSYTEHDPVSAQSAFARAGLRRSATGQQLNTVGKPVTFALEPPAQSPPLVQAARTIAQHLQQAGLSVTVQPQDRGARASRFRDAEFDVALAAGEGGIDPVLSPTWYLAQAPLMSFAPLWAQWAESRGARGEEPPEPAREQQRLYAEIVSTADLEEQRRLAQRILVIAKEQLWVIGVALPPTQNGFVSQGLLNFPDSMIAPSREHVEPGSSAPEVFARGS
jgi:ABC-type transport system substrate-binding protein